MANRYWNPAANANWGDASVWALTDGGTANQATPTDADVVYFTSTNVKNCTITATAYATGLDFTGGTGYTGTLTNSNQELESRGNVTFSSGMTLTWGGSSTLSIRGSGTQTITMNTKSIGGTLLMASGTTVFGDNYNGKSISLYAGTLNANNKNVTLTSSFSSVDATTRVITMGSGTWTLGLQWNITNSTGLTFNKDTATIKMNGSSVNSFNGFGLTYYNLWQTGSLALTITGSNTFNDFKIDAGKSVIFTDGTDQTVTSLTWDGSVGNLITLNGTSTAGWKVSDTTGTNTVTYCDIHYSTAEGGATFNSLLTAGNVDGGNNSGWVFTEAAAGPANLKSYNTNALANIKSIDGNLIANCKSLNTNV